MIKGFNFSPLSWKCNVPDAYVSFTLRSINRMITKNDKINQNENVWSSKAQTFSLSFRDYLYDTNLGWVAHGPHRYYDTNLGWVGHGPHKDGPLHMTYHHNEGDGTPTITISIPVGKYDLVHLFDFLQDQLYDSHHPFDYGYDSSYPNYYYSSSSYDHYYSSPSDYDYHSSSSYYDHSYYPFNIYGYSGYSGDSDDGNSGSDVPDFLA